MKDDIKTYLTSVGVDWEEVNDLAMVSGWEGGGGEGGVARSSCRGGVEAG